LQEDGSYKKVEISQPKNKNIFLSDILDKNVDEKYFMNDIEYLNKLVFQRKEKSLIIRNATNQ
jgi:hypothetical protein